MSYLVDRKIELHFRTAATVVKSGKVRAIVVESRPNYAVLKLAGSPNKYPIAWKQIFQIAERKHAENLRLESEAAKEIAQELKRRAKAKPKKSRQTSPKLSRPR